MMEFSKHDAQKCHEETQKEESQCTWHKSRHEKKIDVKKLWWKRMMNQHTKKKCDETSQDAKLDETKWAWLKK
jgi:hypothetical protein